jgi:anti-anti-sigma factor
MKTVSSKAVESRSLIAGYLRISWTLSGIDPAEIRLQGVLDLVGSDALDRIIAGILNKTYCRILVDLRKLERMTAAGAEGILKLSQESRRRAARLALVGPPEGVLTFIQNVGLKRQIDVYSSAEEAIRGIEAEL